MTDKTKLYEAIEAQGFNLDDCPVETIPCADAWESFPIIKAIRMAEKETGIKYWD